MKYLYATILITLILPAMILLIPAFIFLVILGIIYNDVEKQKNTNIINSLIQSK